MKKAIVHIRESNDCDHFAPIIWKLLESQWRVTIFTVYGFKAEDDYRIKFLKKYFTNLKIINPTRIYSAKSTLFYKIFVSLNYKNFITRAIFRIINFPFKIIEGNLFKNAEIIIWDWGNPGRVNHFESLLYGINTIVLPHGIDIFLNRYDSKIDLGDRAIYDYYFLNSEFQKNIAKKLLNMNAHKIHTIGSPRFSKKWIMKLLEFLESFDFGNKNNGKVLYFLPHIDHAPNFQEIESLIIRLSKIDNIALVVKMSTRQKNVFTPKALKLLKNINNVCFDSNTPSTTLIEWSDTVINHGSSIVFDAFQLNKRVIHASFLDNFKSIFDDSDCVYHSDDIDDICEIIASSDSYPPKNSSKLIQEFVYNNEDHEPIDILYNFLLTLKDKKFLD